VLTGLHLPASRPALKHRERRTGKIAAAVLTAALLCSFGGREASAATSQTLRVAGNTIVVSSGITDGAVTFNGQRIIDSKDGAVMAHGTYSAPGKAFVLFETDQGPSCAMFQIVAVAGRQASVSPVFGNCGGADASVVNGALRVRIAVVPAHGTFPTSPVETHSFDGKTFR
jgi:hypothetical protein